MTRKGRPNLPYPYFARPSSVSDRVVLLWHSFHERSIWRGTMSIVVESTSSPVAVEVVKHYWWFSLNPCDWHQCSYSRCVCSGLDHAANNSTDCSSYFYFLSEYYPLLLVAIWFILLASLISNWSGSIQGGKPISLKMVSTCLVE